MSRIAPRARDPKRRRSGDAGFLLAEALVTMAIGAFLLFAMVSLVHLAMRADARTQDLSGTIETETRLLDALARDLRGALRLRQGGTGAAFVFAGTPDAIQFAAREGADGEIRLVALRAGAGRIERRSAELPPNGVAPVRAGDDLVQIIDTGGTLVRFGYVQPLPNGEEALVDDWSAPLAMPSAVRIALTDRATGAIRSSLRVALMIDAEPGCAAPLRSVCSYVETGAADLLGSADLPREAVDAQDPLGWARYAR